MKILFVASEAYPLVKTGGLGDVCGSLPPALVARGAEVRLLLPAYREARARAGRLHTVARLKLPGGEVALLEGALPDTSVPLWLLDHPPSYDRPGGPYLDPLGRPWDDNAARFALLCAAACAIALGQTPLGWRPELVHGHDWQTGLVAPLLAAASNRPATVFTIHNLAYQGLFPAATLRELGLPPALWSPEALEFHGQLSFIKGGICFADRLNTVSPTYAREIGTPEYGCGLDGLLRHRAAALSGILNGIDDRTWDPAASPHLPRPYSAHDRAGKRACKIALQTDLGLGPEPEIPVIGMVGRLVHQKGIDLLLEALPALDRRRLQLVVLGSGETGYETALRAAAAARPGRMTVTTGYDERLAHRILAGADLLLMPSRFEPCGLTQLHALRYGTVPVVRRVGGLADTVTGAGSTIAEDAAATGFLFDEAGAGALVAALDRALAAYGDTGRWRRLILNGMSQDHSWNRSAGAYLDLYRRAIAARNAQP